MPKGLSPWPWPVATAADFDAQSLSPNWSSLRAPVDESWLSLRERSGWLRLRGRESQHSLFEQSLIARRLQSFVCTFETQIDFTPTHFTQSAGLICWYDTRTHFYLRITHDPQMGKVLGIVLTDDGNYDELLESQIAIEDSPEIYLRAQIDHDLLRFSASADSVNWTQIGPPLDASKLSDDYGQGLHFTGALVGLCCQDLRGTNAVADFRFFKCENPI